jgi:hypothetical protein
MKKLSYFVTSVLFAILCGLITISNVFGAGAANFVGTWQCPGRGVLTITTTYGTKITAEFRGLQSGGGHWGSSGRKGGTHYGEVLGQTAETTGGYGDGTRSTETMTLEPDGKKFNGTYVWYRGQQKLGSGTWSCHR